MKNYLDGLTIEANQTNMMASAALAGVQGGGAAPSKSPDAGKQTAPPSQAHQPTTKEMEHALPGQ